MKNSSNCLILKRYKNYQALFLTQSKSYINCFGVTDKDFELLFTYKEKNPSVATFLNTAGFKSSTVNDESKVILKDSYDQFFGVSIDLISQTLKIIKKENRLNRKSIRILEKFYDFRIEKTFKNLSQLCLAHKNNASCRILLNTSGELKELLRLDKLLYGKRKEDIFEKITSVSVKSDPSKNFGKSVVNIIVSTPSLISIVKLNLRLKKVIRKTQITMDGVRTLLDLGPELGEMSFTSHCFNPRDESLFVTTGRFRLQEMGRPPQNHLERMRLVKIKDVFWFRNKTQAVESVRTGCYGELIELSHEHLIVNQTTGGINAKKFGLVQKKTLEIQTLDEKVGFFKTLRFPYSGAKNISVDCLEDSSVILRTSCDIFKISLPYLKKLNQGNRFHNDGGLKDSFSEIQSADLPHFTHCYKPPDQCSIQTKNGFLVYEEPDGRMIRVFRNESQAIQEVVSIQDKVDIDMGDNVCLGSFYHISELKDRTILLVTKPIQKIGFNRTEMGFSVLKISPPFSAAKLNVSHLQIAGGIGIEETQIIEVTDKWLVINIVDDEAKRHFYWVNTDNLDKVYLQDTVDLIGFDILFYMKENELIKSSDPEREESKLDSKGLPWVRFFLLSNSPSFQLIIKKSCLIKEDLKLRNEYPRGSMRL